MNELHSTSEERQKKSESGRGKKKFRVAFLPPNPTDEDLQKMADFLNGKLDKDPNLPSTPTD